MLGDKTKSKDIHDIIAKTTSTSTSTILTEYDFSRMVNPYGLEKVVFTGGGSKGITYLGVILGHLATGQIFYLNHFSGTSIGAMSSLILGCITPTGDEYNCLKISNLGTITTRFKPIVERYQEAISFVFERFTIRDISTFYTLPTYTFYGVWTAIDTVIKKNGLYDVQNSSFQIWYALICKKICHIMKNGLDNLIIIKKSDGTFVEFSETTILPSTSISVEEYSKLYLEYCGGIDFDTETFTGWEIVRFFTFTEYNALTNKTLVITGTQTKPYLQTVYYTHTNRIYRDQSVMVCTSASMSIPVVFKATVINNSYNMDGGIFDNYPLTHCDIKTKDKITHYNNKIFGYLIDDKSSVIDAYEILRELWLMYDGFIEIMNIGYLNEAPNFSEISELFFEIRSEIYKLLYFTDVDLETFLNRDCNREKVVGFSIVDLEEIINSLIINPPPNCPTLELVKKGTKFVEFHLNQLNSKQRHRDTMFKIGKKTDLADIFELSIKHGATFNTICDLILNDITKLENIEPSDDVLIRYLNILKHMMKNILGYYDLKGNFIRCDDLETPGEYLSEIMMNMYKKLIAFEKLTDTAVGVINKNVNKNVNKTDISVTIVKNYIKNSIQIGTSMISKILTKGTGSNIDTSDDIETDQKKSSYTKAAVDYFFQTDMTGILYKYMCIANDRICNDLFNRMRTIKINTFETSTLHFDMDDELKARLIYEGYSKTIKYLTSLLHIMELTERPRSVDEYLESYEMRYKHSV